MYPSLNSLFNLGSLVAYTLFTNSEKQGNLSSGNPIPILMLFVLFNSVISNLTFTVIVFMILCFNCYYLFNFDDANIQQVFGFAKF